MLIRNAELASARLAGLAPERFAGFAAGRLADCRIDTGKVREIGGGGTLRPAPREAVIEARGGALLPGLADHHLHLQALAASLESLRCGPPDVEDEEALSSRLREAGTTGSGWIRGIGYHDSVAGPIDRAWLDGRIAHRPARIQHRSGQLWVLNSRAIDRVRHVAARPSADDERAAACIGSGRFFGLDEWLRQRLPSVRPSLDLAGALLASFGVTEVCDLTPDNDDDTLSFFAAEQARGALHQRIRVAGRLAMTGRSAGPRITLGPTKLHLRESALPEYHEVVSMVRASHAVARPVAIHCTTRVELVFALGVFEEAGAMAGDRIEHASILPPECFSLVRELGIAIVTQPNFIAERGDAYLADVDPEDRASLYRLRSLIEYGLPVAAGTDAPFGNPDPWAAMRAARERRARSGRLLGADEAVTAEVALSLFAADAEDRAQSRKVQVGMRADLCLLDLPWAEAREALSASRVSATICAGRIVHSSRHVARWGADCVRSATQDARPDQRVNAAEVLRALERMET